MAKTGIIATALLNTSKGKFEPGEAVKGLPPEEMKTLRKLKAVKEVILEADEAEADKKTPPKKQGGSPDNNENGEGSKTDGSKTDPKTDKNGDK